MLEWYNPPTGVYTAHGIEVSVNPELGLVINGQRHLIKLYFKADALAKNRTEIISHIMDVTLQTKCSEQTTMAILDIRTSKLLSPTVPISGLSSMLNAELAYIKDFWSSTGAM